LDAETTASHVLTITASDGTGPIDTATVTITVTDVDEFDVSTPVDANAAANAVNENASAGTVVGVTGSASDADATTNGVTYAITGGTGLGLFAIDANTGVVTVLGSIDRETTGPSVDIEVTATSQDGSSSAQTFTIAIGDVDEFNPVFNAADYPATVAEDISDVTTIATVTATDADATAVVTYSITGGDPDGLFEVDANTGGGSLGAWKAPR